MDVFQQILPILTFIGGLVGAGVLDRRRDLRQARLSAAAADKAAEREDGRYAREFERETLLELEQLLLRLGRVTAELNYDVNAWVLAGHDLEDHQVSAELSEQERQLNGELHMLLGRVRRDDIRQAVLHMRTLLAIAARPDEADYESMMLSFEQASVAGELTQLMIGDRLRELIYGEGTPRPLPSGNKAAECTSRRRS